MILYKFYIAFSLVLLSLNAFASGGNSFVEGEYYTKDGKVTEGLLKFVPGHPNGSSGTIKFKSNESTEIIQLEIDKIQSVNIGEDSFIVMSDLELDLVKTNYFDYAYVRVVTEGKIDVYAHLSKSSSPNGVVYFHNYIFEKEGVNRIYSHPIKINKNKIGRLLKDNSLLYNQFWSLKKKGFNRNLEDIFRQYNF